MKKAAVLTLALVIGVVGAAQAFDGKRTGFVFGGGIGYASSIKTTVDVSTSQSFGDQIFLGTLENDDPGIAGQLMFGIGLDEQNMLVYEANVGLYTVKNVNLFNDGFLYDVKFAQGTGTISLYHYWGRVGSSLFTAGGVGLSYFDTDYTDPNDYGLAWMAAVGYEFSPHVQLGVYLTGGQSKFTQIPGLEGDFTQSNVEFMLTAVAF